MVTKGMLSSNSISPSLVILWLTTMIVPAESLTVADSAVALLGDAHAVANSAVIPATSATLTEESSPVGETFPTAKAMQRLRCGVSVTREWLR
jgi:hypothetical protein